MEQAFFDEGRKIMQDMMIDLMNQYGYLGILLLIAIENLFPPIPSEVVLTFSGFLTTYTQMTIWGAVLASTAGAVIGAIILYWLGRILNKERFMRIVEGKIGRILRLKKEDVEKADHWFGTKGNMVVFFGRFVPIIRSLISIPAGMSEMHFGRFLLLTTIGSGIWNTVLIFVGSVVGESWEDVVAIMEEYSFLTLCVLGIVGIIAVWLYYKKRIRKQ
ncbi:DedA family protein [Anaerosporobacter faecicola]|uniref:DedA family protein n=1 Tax=Anaerosporobacter faecicola TaxID=2718714 RepID=UPI001EE56777|nr:DedA family protein [Anaerosporobacter faecicola]